MIWLYVAQEMSEMQNDDIALKHVMTWKFSGVKSEWEGISSESVEVKHHWARFDAIELKDNVQYRKWESECGNKELYVVDYSAKEVITKSDDRVT